MIKLKFSFIISFIGLVLSPAAAYATSDIEVQRQQFIEAEQALKSGNWTRYKKLKDQLQGYPLYPYLVSADLSRRLTSAASEEIDQFLTQNGASLAGEKFRKEWLRHQAQRKNWQTFLAYYIPNNDVEFQCYYRRALLASDNDAVAFENLDKLWLVDHKQPESCEALFSAWQQYGGLSREKVWQRYQMAMDAHHLSVARQIERYFSPQDRRLATLWQQVDHNPKLIFSSKELQKDEPLQRAIVMHGIARMARKDINAASEAWRTLQERQSYTEQERATIESKLALTSALKNIYRPPEELVSLNPALASQQAREWRIRSAIAMEDWETALVWLNHLPESTRDSSQWQYWRARALETDDYPRAKEIYEDLAQVRNYYGFLAADRLGQPYAFSDQPLNFPETDLESMKQHPGIMRAHELYRIGRLPDARREWNYNVRRMSDPQLAMAAKLAHEWNWHDRAILTAEQSVNKNDLSLRFPTPHEQQVLNEAASRNIDPAWAFAMMRQESVFMADARSPVGALGLMQLMPQTGRLVARSLNKRLPSNRSLLDANTNIRFGITYLRSVLDTFNENPVLATAAYNAGGHRVKNWLPENRVLPADIWVETVPFYETRNYLQNVFAYTVVYDYRLNRNVKPLNVRMPPIVGKGTPQSGSMLGGEPRS